MKYSDLTYRSCTTCVLNPEKNNCVGAMFSEAGAIESLVGYIVFGYLDVN